MRLLIMRRLSVSKRLASMAMTVAWSGLLGVLARGGGVRGGVGGVAVLSWGSGEAGEVSAAMAAE